MTVALFVLALLSGCAGVPEVHDEHSSDHDNERAVSLSPEAVKSARIVVEPAVNGALSPEISIPAHIALDPRKEAIVSAWIGGQVDGIDVRTGDEIKKGQRLATVQSPELGEAVAAHRAAVAMDDAGEARLERLQRLEKDGVAAHAQVLDAEASHAEADGALGAAVERLRVLGVDPSVGDSHAGERYPSRVPVRSPIAGKVLKADATVGRRVEPGETLFHVGDLSEVWLLLDLFARDLPSVSVGQPVRFEVDGWPDEVFEGVVEQVGDWVDPTSRTVEVRVVVDNPGHKLKPNMYANATLSLAKANAEQGIVLPAQAIQEIDGHDVVFVEEEDGHFEAREVEVRDRSGIQALLTSGIEPGERIVTEGAFALKSELEKSELGEGHAH